MKIEKAYPERWGRLPRWAQDEFRRMEDRVEAAKQKYEDVLAEQPATRLVVEPYDYPRRFLPEKSAVRFELSDTLEPNRDWVDFRFRRDRNGPHVDILGGDSIRFEPRSSNTALLRVFSW